MTFLYENLLPDRFQQLVQSLLLEVYPKLQCMPIGQPDGGRDGWDPDSKTVLQVKFKKAGEEESADWMIKTLEGELPKIRRLVERGATEYVMVTNAQGTSHLDVGRIDKVANWLSENLSIPASCLWRDDLDRRLEKSPTALRLKYSEILPLQDGIDILLSTIYGSSAQRQDDAIRSFIASQFQTDSTVKFKQVHLSNDLLDLFIDVPIGIPQKTLNSRTHRRQARALMQAMQFSRTGSSEDNSHQVDVLPGDDAMFYRNVDIGTAELLLSDTGQEHLKLVVLEGAPGQGKSTLAQYVCQVQRAKYLKKNDMLEKVQPGLSRSSFRVPVKVDLRDYAGFLTNESPFENDQTKGKPRTLDVFIAELITYHSGGIDFSPHEVLTLLKNAPVLIFLDGLDEVADVALRDSLIGSVGEAVARWQEFFCDFQVVVTSRPSVFGRPASLEKHGFITLKLKNIDRQRIDQYADKWITARNLDVAERSDVKKILAEKLELAHIRDLTRNPMQLTILLSLIHQIGHSLPDQRTDLYRRYVDLFLTREADKSARVRDHRPVLLDFIKYLAWILQSQAESSRKAGSIAEADLQSLAKDFMRREGQPEAIATDLFGGGLERIFVLVERIEGLYEFEVQPLREYFCAQYLYSTAPVGSHKDLEYRGDRSERFTALARNPFWLNVCRFYAGSAERGETGSIVFCLEELIGSPDAGVSLHARKVAVALIQDWVFSGVKFVQERLIRIVFDDVGVGILLHGERANEDLVFDVECGRDIVRSIVFENLLTWDADHRTSRICTFLRHNGGEYLSQEFIDWLSDKRGESRTHALIRMFRSGAAHDVKPADVWRLITADNPTESDLAWRIGSLIATELDLALSIDGLAERYLAEILAGVPNSSMHSMSPFGLLNELLVSGRSVYANVPDRLLSGDALHTYFRVDDARCPADMLSFLKGAQDLMDGRGEDLELLAPPEHISALVELGRRTLGDQWALYALAIRGACMPQAYVPLTGSHKLFDDAIPLYSRARYARVRRRSMSWWRDQLADAENSMDRMFWLALFLRGNTLATVASMSKEINALVLDLTETEFLALEFVVGTMHKSTRRKALAKVGLDAVLDGFCGRSAVLLARAVPDGFAVKIFTPPTELLAEEPFQSVWEGLVLEEELESPPDWKDVEAVTAWAAGALALQRSRLVHSLPFRTVPERTSEPLAVAIFANPSRFPGSWAWAASHFLQRHLKARSLESVAKDDAWVFM